MRHARDDLDGWARESTHMATTKSKGRPFADHLRQPNRELSNHNLSALPPTRGAPFWPMTSQNSRLAISLSLHAIYLVCKVHLTPAPPWRTLLRPTSHVESSGTTIVHQSQTLHFMYCLGRIVLRCRPQRYHKTWICYIRTLSTPRLSQHRGACVCTHGAAVMLLGADSLAFHVLTSGAPTGTPGTPRGSAN